MAFGGVGNWSRIFGYTMRRSSPFAVWAALLGTAALLAGCCANDTCDCNDQLEDAIQVRFNVSDTTQANSPGFRLREVNTIRLVRYRLAVDGSTPATPDTVVLQRPKTQAADPIIIANTAPFAISGTLKVNAYRYAILLTNANRRAPQVRQRYDLTDIQLSGGFQADGCCTCYENTSLKGLLSVSPPGVNSLTLGALPVDLKQVIELRRP